MVGQYALKEPKTPQHILVIQIDVHWHFWKLRWHIEKIKVFKTKNMNQTLLK
jgi:hypothetical protein